MAHPPATQSKTKPRKETRWGCLSLLIIPTLLFAGARAYDSWRERRPLPVQLSEVFRESGFEVPDSVTDIRGGMSEKDFQGDFSSEITFTVREADVDSFTRLSPKLWKHPERARISDTTERFGSIEAPAGTLVIEERESSEYQCKFGVNKKLRQIYFFRSST